MEKKKKDKSPCLPIQNKHPYKGGNDILAGTLVKPKNLKVTGGICILKVIPITMLTHAKLQLWGSCEKIHTWEWEGDENMWLAALEQIVRVVVQITIVSSDIK